MLGWFMPSVPRWEALAGPGPEKIAGGEVVVANVGPPQPSPEQVDLEVWLDKVAEVLAAILTRRDRGRDDGGQKYQEDRREDS